MQVMFPGGSSCVYLALVTWCSLVFGKELFTDCSLSSVQASPPATDSSVLGPQAGRSFCGPHLPVESGTTPALIRCGAAGRTHVYLQFSIGQVEQIDKARLVDVTCSRCSLPAMSNSRIAR
jgi:hypothetical protein